MTTFISRKSALLFIATLTVAVSASAADVGPWPTTQPYMWNTNATSRLCGSIFRQPDYLNNLVMTGYHIGPKNETWLPYGLLNGSLWNERLCLAQLIGTANAPVTNIHVKILDQRGATGANGWAVILKDSAGRILDFGVRSFYRTGYLMPHEWDGTNWVNYVSDGFFSPYYVRSVVDPAYYTMDFAQNGNGTITWTIAGWDPINLDFLADTNTTTTAYGSITEVYLSVNTTSGSVQDTHKWTEFSVLPQVISPPPLKIAPTNTAEVALWWPSPWTTSFVVQTNADLNTTAWGDVTATPDDDGTTITVTLPIQAGNQFFRLKK